jgi:hypothetical protein
VALGADQSFANLHWCCHTPAGERLAAFQTGYLLIRAPAGIRVAHVAQYEEASEKATEKPPPTAIDGARDAG